MLVAVPELRVLGVSPECTVRIWFHNVLLRNAVGSGVAVGVALGGDSGIIDSQSTS